jgi:hypothetical protein
VRTQAPLLIWPKDFQDEDSIALIADLGQVNFSTTNQGEADTFDDKKVLPCILDRVALEPALD